MVDTSPCFVTLNSCVKFGYITSFNVYTIGIQIFHYDYVYIDGAEGSRFQAFSNDIEKNNQNSFYFVGIY